MLGNARNFANFKIENSDFSEEPLGRQQRQRHELEAFPVHDLDLRLHFAYDGHCAPVAELSRLAFMRERWSLSRLGGSEIAKETDVGVHVVAHVENLRHREPGQGRELLEAAAVVDVAPFEALHGARAERLPLPLPQAEGVRAVVPLRLEGLHYHHVEDLVMSDQLVSRWLI